MNLHRGASSQEPEVHESPWLRLASLSGIVAVGIVGAWFAVEYAIAGNWAGVFYVVAAFGTLEAAAIVVFAASERARRAGERHAS
jgi:hypothetical protein